MMPAPPRAGFTRMPVPSAPTMPPMQWTTNRPSEFFTTVQKNRQTTPTTRPSTIAPIGPAKPAAGVTATRPATAPDNAPSTEGWPLTIHSANIQAIAPAAVATKELDMAGPAPPEASRFDPALKPNQPTQSSEAPIMDMVSECGAINSLP